MLANTPASFEPTLDYVVTKIARFPFDKFSDASNKLGTQMKATGEVMSIGRTMEESLLKADAFARNRRLPYLLTRSSTTGRTTGCWNTSLSGYRRPTVSPSRS